MRITLIRSISLITALFCCLSAQAAEVEGVGNTSIPEWFKESFLDIRGDIKEAASQNKRLMLYFHQNGCPYCAELVNNNFSQKNIVDYMAKNFDAIDINMWGDREVTTLDGNILSEKKYAASKKVWFTPTLLFFNEMGDVVLRVNGYYPPHQFLAALEYVAGKHENKTDFRSFYAKKSPPKSSGKLNAQSFFMKPPYMLKRNKKQKPLAVLFEQKDCPACDTLHKTIIPLAGTKKQLKRFDVVQLDMWSNTPVTTPSGKKTTAKQWAKKLGIAYAPSIVCFDKGKEAVRMEAFLKSFHVQSVLDYCASRAYIKQPSLQRFIERRAQKILDRGGKVDLWEK
jgi:thioredoxin-related protein